MVGLLLYRVFGWLAECLEIICHPLSKDFSCEQTFWQRAGDHWRMLQQRKPPVSSRRKLSSKLPAQPVPTLPTPTPHFTYPNARHSDTNYRREIITGSDNSPITRKQTSACKTGDCPRKKALMDGLQKNPPSPFVFIHLFI